MQSPLRFALMLTLLPLAAGAGGCATTAPEPAVQEVEVEGRVTVRGNEPFTAVILETEDGNWYKLALTDEQRRGLVNPSIQRARGVVSRGDWNSRPFAVLTVRSIVRVER